ncbi:tRNA-dihydrouridine synthase family protein [Patescibacteria group bacterium]|nr:tRNA-dihydrouridine synthase family protein [Patescibacteria group bacterium]
MDVNFWNTQNTPFLCLAPLAGISDSATRQICKKFGADILYTEMISADALFYNSKKTLQMLKISKKEHPVVVQLFGKNPETFKKAAKICCEYGFDGIDINFGCPARKVVSHGGGVFLMKDFDKSRKIVENVITNSSIPVSIKIRTGISDILAIDFLKNLEDLPISAIMVHGRTYEQKFSGEIDYNTISEIREYFSSSNTKIIANGGIFTPENAKKVLDNTGVSGLGIARGIYGKPYIFKQIKDFLKKGKYSEFDISDIKKLIKLHSKVLFKTKPERARYEIRKYLLWYTKGIPNIKELRNEMTSVNSISDINKLLKKF